MCLIKKSTETIGASKPVVQMTQILFQLLKEKGTPVSFLEKTSENEFIQKSCLHIPIQVITRAYASGSYNKRFPFANFNQPRPFKVLPEVTSEFFLKSNKAGFVINPFNKPFLDLNKFKKPRIPKPGIFHPLICNPENAILVLRNSEIPTQQKASFLTEIDKGYILPEAFGLKVDYFKKIAQQAFMILKSQFALSEYDLIDLKLDFGWHSDEGLVCTGVIDTGSFRLYPRGDTMNEFDKKSFYTKEMDTVKDVWKRESSMLGAVKSLVH